MDKTLPSTFAFWRRRNTAPFHFPMSPDIWFQSLNEDVDSDGRTLFARQCTRYSRTEPNKGGRINGMIQYGITAFGFDDSGEISADIHYPVIRILCFEEQAVGQTLLEAALDDLGRDERIYAFFHYFGMSACGRHGKLHEKDLHIHSLLAKNGFIVEHENVYYSRSLTEADRDAGSLMLHWKPLSAGDCREFAAVKDGQEIGWGQVHFLPQGDIAYLRWIYIDERRQHQGLGTAAMRALFSGLYSMGIRRFDTDTALSNVIAQRYYEKNGFTNEGITRSYFTK